QQVARLLLKDSSRDWKCRMSRPSGCTFPSVERSGRANLRDRGLSMQANFSGADDGNREDSRGWGIRGSADETSFRALPILRTGQIMLVVPAAFGGPGRDNRDGHNPTPP